MSHMGAEQIIKSSSSKTVILSTCTHSSGKCSISDEYATSLKLEKEVCPVHYILGPVHPYVFGDLYLLSDRQPQISSNFPLRHMGVFPLAFSMSSLHLVHIILEAHCSKLQQCFH